MKKIVFSLILFLLILPKGYMQVKKMGKVSVKEFKTKVNDTSANAIILFKDVKAYIEFVRGEGWVLKRKVHKRILLLNDKAFDYATVKIPLYEHRGMYEKASVKAYTYNLNNGKIVKTKLSKKDIFLKKENKFWSQKKFTMPNVQKNSIIDYEYYITSPFISKVDNIYYQEYLPMKYVHIKVSFPEFFVFNYFINQYFPVKPIEKQRLSNITISSVNRRANTSSSINTANVDVNFKDNEITLKDVPAFKPEPYINSPKNYIGKISFELVAYNGPSGEREYFARTWEDVAQTVYFNSHFGDELKDNSYFKDDLNLAIKDIKDDKRKIAAILNFVKNKIKWNGFYAKYTGDRYLKRIYKEGKGNYADVNLFLTNALRSAGFSAYPVLISTVENGIPLFPTLDGFDAVITVVRLNDEDILLDATDQNSFLNVLPERDYNWQGRLVKKDGSSENISLFPKDFSILHNKLIIKMNDDLGFTGLLKTIYSNNYAMKYRKKYKDLENDKVIKLIEDKYSNEVEIQKIRLKNIKKPSAQMQLDAMISIEDGAEELGDKIIFSPLFFLREKENIFKDEKRKFPIFFSFPRYEDFEVVINIPENYTIEKIPEDFVYKLPDNLGAFTFKVTKNGNQIVVRAITNINFPLLSQNYYKDIRELFKQRVIKENEKVILIQKK